MPRHTAAPPRTVNAPLPCGLNKEGKAGKKKKSADDEKTWSCSWSGEQRPVWFTRLNPVPVSGEVRFSAQPVRSLSARLTHTETRGGFEGFSVNEVSPPERDSSDLTVRVNLLFLLLKQRCQDFVPAGFNHLLFVGRSGWCCGSRWSHTDGGVTGAGLYYRLNLPLNAGLSSRDSGAVEDSADGIISPGIIIHIILLLVIIGRGEGRWGSIDLLCGIDPSVPYSCLSVPVLSRCVPGWGAPCPSACRCPSSCRRFRRTGAPPPPPPSPPRCSAAGTPSTCWRRSVLTQGWL